MHKRVARYVRDNPNNLLIIAGSTLILLAIPFTVFLANTQQNVVDQPKAATTPLTPCSKNCGDPRFFCDTWTGGFCDDYRNLYSTSTPRQVNTGSALMPFTEFPDATRVGKTSVATFSSTDPGYVPAGIHGAPPFCYDRNGNSVAPPSGYATAPGLECNGFWFNDQEHFHSLVEDGDFGIALQRINQPFDFSGRTGHIHFDIDLKTSARRYARIMLSPQLTKTVTDDRLDQGRPCPALDLWFLNGTLKGNEYKMGSSASSCSGSIYGNLFDNPNGYRYYGTDNVRDHVDIYVSRTHLKMTITHPDNTTVDTPIDMNIPDTGFDKAYVYFVQASYNPVKDSPQGDSHGTIPEEALPNYQFFHWDNVAFDGPVLPVNSLTPIGSRDVIFNAFSMESCKVKGVNASVIGPVRDTAWISWVARLPDDGTAVTKNDVSCSGNNYGSGYYDGIPRSFEIVKQSSTGTTPPPTDTTAPTVTLTAPAAGTVSGTVTVSATASDNVGVSRVDFYEGTSLISSDTTSPYSISWNTSTLTNGVHTLSAKAYDAAGNIGSTLASVSVTVSNSTPTAKLGDVNNDSKVNILDISNIIAKWGANNKPAEDVNQDGRVDISDIALVIAHWG